MKNPYESLQIVETKEHPFTKRERLKAMEGPILSWFYENSRTLPWRSKPTPYRVWISEIMLQQTRVEAVKPYFERFMKELPDIKALAAVSEDRLFKLWEGLGYYNRARNLQKSARLAVEKYEGRLPASYEKLLEFPGIGSYTAGAISSIAFGIAVPAVDGNVLRVISRVLASGDDISKQSVKNAMEKDLSAVIPRENPGDYNQALIEVGAILCIPNGEARCKICPLYSLCLARQQNIVDRLPIKGEKKERRIENRTILLIENEAEVVIRKRPDKGLLAGLYELPNTESHLSRDEVKNFMKSEGLMEVEITPLEAARHIFSYVEWRMIGYRIQVKTKLPGHYQTAKKETVKKLYSFPTAFKAYTSRI